MYGYKVGDRVKVVGRMDDPHPLEIGLEGTITGFSEFAGQVHVKWDNGRSLMLLLPEDLRVFTGI
jgi:hypothetical protein